MTPKGTPTAGEELDAIMRDLDATTKAWAAAGHKFDGPEHEAREAVFARLKAWNKARLRVADVHHDRRPCPHGCAGGHTEDEYYGGDCPHRDSEPFEGWGPGR